MTEILLLSNNENSKELYEWICMKTSAKLYSDKITLDVLKQLKPKFVISYNYKYKVPADCIAYMNKRIINMHISYLPWNKGSSPNIWSFIENSPKGVTIQEMSPELDEGEIIFQKEVTFDYEKDTLASSYEKLNCEIVNLFKEHWEELYSGNYVTQKQNGEGSYHTMKDLEKFKEKVEFNWSDKISDFLHRIDMLRYKENL